MIDARLKNIYINIQSDLSGNIVSLTTELQEGNLNNIEKTLLKSAISNLKAAVSRLEAINRTNLRRG